jgi:DNA-binding response OmpR family regulator
MPLAIPYNSESCRGLKRDDMHTLNREPLFEDASAEASAKATCAAGDTDPQASTRRSFRVLVVEDETDSRELIKIALTDKDYDLVFLDNGTAALEECKRQLPDIAILDFQLPGHSGLEICRYIKENSGRRFIPTLILTSQTELCDKVAGLNHGADEYIAKPFQLPELEAQVRALLRIKALTDELEQTRSKLEDRERQLVAAHVAGAHEPDDQLRNVQASRCNRRAGKITAGDSP